MHMVISRGPSRPIRTKPGEERTTFLRQVATLLDTDYSSLDTTADLVEQYGVDELEVFEYVQIAEDVWRVVLNPNPMTDADFAEMRHRFTNLDAIITAAEAARTRADA